MTSSITNLGKFPKSFITPYIFVIIITNYYPRVQKLTKIKYFDYFLMCRPIKLDREYICARFREIWVKLVKVSRLGCIHPLSSKIYNNGGNSVSWQRRQTWNLIIIKTFGHNDVIFGPIGRHFYQHFLIIIKFDVCHRCQDPELPLVSIFPAKRVNTSQSRKVY